MTLFAPMDPRSKVVARDANPSHKTSGYGKGVTTAMEDRLIELMGCGTQQGGKLPKTPKSNVPKTTGDDILALIYGKWMTCAQISTALDIKAGTVTTALRRLRKGGYTKTSGTGNAMTHYGLQLQTRATAKRAEVADRHDEILESLNGPRSFEEISKATGLSGSVLHNSLVALLHQRRIVCQDAALLGMAPSVKYLYARAEVKE